VNRRVIRVIQQNCTKSARHTPAKSCPLTNADPRQAERPDPSGESGSAAATATATWQNWSGLAGCRKRSSDCKGATTALAHNTVDSAAPPAASTIESDGNRSDPP